MKTKIQRLTALAKSILLLCLVGFSMFSLPTAKAGIWIYPTYGYNVQENLCQIKQSSAESIAREDLEGEYDSLRECRISHPKVFLNSGFGIAIWFSIVLFIFISNFWILDKMKKRNKTEKHLSTLFDLHLMGLALLFSILLQHYFSVTYAYYDYGSDLDHLFYANLINPNGALPYAVLYLIYFLGKIAIIYKNRHEVKSN